MSRLTLVALVAAGSLGLAACTPEEAPQVQDDVPIEETERPEEDDTDDVDDDGRPDGALEDGVVEETINVTAEEFSFTGIPETLPEGTIQIDFENTGSAEHNLVIEELDDEEVIPVLATGESYSATVTLEPGTYTFYCSVGNHRAQGMEAVVTVE